MIFQKLLSVSLAFSIGVCVRVYVCVVPLTSESSHWFLIDHFDRFSFVWIVKLYKTFRITCVRQIQIFIECGLKYLPNVISIEFNLPHLIWFDGRLLVCVRVIFFGNIVYVCVCLVCDAYGKLHKQWFDSVTHYEIGWLKNWINEFHREHLIELFVIY